jgi:hypothetical protein
MCKGGMHVLLHLFLLLLLLLELPCGYHAGACISRPHWPQVVFGASMGLGPSCIRMHCRSSGTCQHHACYCLLGQLLQKATQAVSAGCVGVLLEQRALLLLT